MFQRNVLFSIFGMKEKDEFRKCGSYTGEEKLYLGQLQETYMEGE